MSDQNGFSTIRFSVADGIAELGLTLPAGAESKLEAFMALLAKWNKSYNLTADRKSVV